MPQPLAKGLRGLLRGGTTTSDALPLEDMPIGTVATTEDIGAAGYDSIVYNFSGLSRLASSSTKMQRGACARVLASLHVSHTGDTACPDKACSIKYAQAS